MKSRDKVRENQSLCGNGIRQHKWKSSMSLSPIYVNVKKFYLSH